MYSKKLKNFASNSNRMSDLDLYKTSWSYQINEFFNCSNLHGVRYLAEKGRPFHEKFLWFGSIVISVIITLIIMLSLAEKFRTSPTVTGLDTDSQHKNVPFPAISVCPQMPTDPQSVIEFINDHWSEKINDQNTLKYYEKFVNQIANLSLENIENLVKYSADDELNKISWRNLLSKVVINCDKLIRDCLWKGVKIICCDSFLPTLTDRGFCYTFNAERFDDDLFASNETTSLKTNRKYIYETDSDLSISFYINSSITDPIFIYIHNSIEKIDIDLYPHYLWTPGKISKILFGSTETYTTDDTRQLSIKQRHCVFPDEIRLSTDEIYTFSACMSQCRINIAMEKCNCVPFFYSKIGKSEYCDLKGLSCIAQFKKDIRKAADCDCELSCSNVVYDVEKLEESKDIDENFQLVIGFMAWPSIRYKREVLFGWVDLFVAFGGIAGSFLGFSVFSAVEIVYFFTLRPYCMIRREKEKLGALYKKYNDKRENQNVNFDHYFDYFDKKQTPNINTNINDDARLPYLP